MYKITRGQLIVLWVFVLPNTACVIGMAIDDHFVGDRYFFFTVFMFFALIFYTLGWRNYRKNNKHKTDE
jgi:hypothetical protein